MYTSTVLILIVGLSFAASDGNITEKGYPKDIVLGRYLVSSKPMTLSQAFAYCTANSMVLLSIQNQIENNEATQFLEYSSNKNSIMEGVGYAWIAAKPLDYDENSYTWGTTGEPVQFTNFEQQLSNLVFDEADWYTSGVIISPTSDKWYVDMPDVTNHAICEK